MGIPRGTIFLILKFYNLFKTLIANRFEEPWKWVFRIRLRRKIGFKINSGNAQFLTKSLQINRPSVSFYKDVWCERKTL